MLQKPLIWTVPRADTLRMGRDRPGAVAATRQPIR